MVPTRARSLVLPLGRLAAAAALLALHVHTGLSVANPAPSASLRPLPLSQVQIRDAFWAPKLQVYREQTVPWSWNYLGWELRALAKAAGQPVSGELNGTWGEANLHKFLETAAYSLAQHPDPQLERRFDEVVTLLAGAQQPDGYLHAYITNNQKPPWDPTFQGEFMKGSW